MARVWVRNCASVPVNNAANHPVTDDEAHGVKLETLDIEEKKRNGKDSMSIEGPKNFSLKVEDKDLKLE